MFRLHQARRQQARKAPYFSSILCPFGPPYLSPGSSCTWATFFFSFSPAWRISGEHFQDTVWNQSLGSDILRIRFKDGICPRVEKAGTPGLERRARQGGNSAPNPAEVAAHVGSVCSPLWACGFLVSEKQKVDFLNVKSQVVFKTLGAAGAKRQTWLWLRSCVISGSWDQAPRQAPCSTYSLFEILSLSQINK